MIRMSEYGVFTIYLLFVRTCAARKPTSSLNLRSDESGARSILKVELSRLYLIPIHAKELLEDNT